MAKELNNKVEVWQCGMHATFRLSDKELKQLRHSSIYTAQEKVYAENHATYGRCYNFSMYAFFEYDTTRAKYGRFAKLFNYHMGDFDWYLITE